MSTFEPVREWYGDSGVDLRNGSAGYCSSEGGPEKPPLGFLATVGIAETSQYEGKQH